MSLMELRDAIESAIPAWWAVVLVAFVLAVSIYGIATRGRRR